MAIDDPPRICGTASAFVERSRALTMLVDACALTVTEDGASIVVTLTPGAGVAPGSLTFNVHHSAAPTGGYPFLASALGVSLTDVEHTIRLDRADRSGPWHLVFQHADAFVARTLHAADTAR